MISLETFQGGNECNSAGCRTLNPPSSYSQLLLVVPELLPGKLRDVKFVWSPWQMLFANFRFDHVPQLLTHCISEAVPMS